MTSILRLGQDGPGFVRLTLFSVLLFCGWLPANGQAGLVDQTFSASVGIAGSGTAFGILPLSGGGSFVYGNFSIVNGIGQNNLVKINSDGTVDTSFQSLLTGSVEAAQIQPDGKILVGGIGLRQNGVTVNGLIRFNPDGTPDSAFQIGTGFSGGSPNIRTILVQADGKILVAGNFEFYRGVARTGLVRINADGTLDTAFAPVFAISSVQPSVTTMNILATGKILVSGRFNTVNGISRPSLARLNPDGSLDTTFDANITGTRPLVVAEQADGKLILDGRRRINSDGTPDTTFQGDNSALVNAIVIQPNGQIIIAGDLTSYKGTPTPRIARINADGSLDTTFNPGTGPNISIFCLKLESDGRVIAGGQFQRFNGFSRLGLARLNTDGSVDQSYQAGFSSPGLVTGLAVQADGKVLAGGQFSLANGVPRVSLARFNPNGSLDTTFDPGAGISGASMPGTPVRFAPLSNGQILVYGKFDFYNNTFRQNLVRINADGSLDTTFAGTTDSTIQGLVVLPDGKILIGGEFAAVNGVARNKIARLNPDGSLDTGFSATVFDAGIVRALAVTPSGKIIVAGELLRLAGQPTELPILRLNADGSPDATFSAPPFASVAPIPFPQILAVALQPDGRIVIGGLFLKINDIFRTNFARLNADGSLDTGFVSGSLNNQTGSSNPVTGIALAPDGKVNLIGFFTIVGGVSRRNVARVNSDGILDTTFNPGLGPNSNDGLSAVALQVDGKLIVGGGFGAFGDSRVSGLARLLGDGDTGCSYALSAPSATVGADGGPVSVTLTTGSGCRWLTSIPPSWITGLPGSGTGTSVISFTVAPSPGGTRSAVITIGDQSFTVTQAGCGYTVSSEAIVVGASGGPRTLAVQTSSSCLWIAFSELDWVTAPDSEIFTGSGAVTIQVAANSGPARSGTIRVAGKFVTIQQAARAGATPGQYRPENGFVYLRNSSSTGFADNEFFYGLANDIPVSGDWDGDGTDSVGIFRNGTFFLRNSNSTGFADLQFSFGATGDIPIAGDWDGDGIDTIGVVRGNQIFLRNSNSTGGADVTFVYGTPTDIFIAGDWDGDGIDSIGCFRPSNGFVFLRNANSTGFADLEFFYGIAGDKPVAGDWDGNGVDSIGVVRGNEWFLRNTNGTGFADIQFTYGTGTDVPIVGNWDGQP